MIGQRSKVKKKEKKREEKMDSPTYRLELVMNSSNGS